MSLDSFYQDLFNDTSDIIIGILVCLQCIFIFITLLFTNYEEKRERKKKQKEKEKE